MLCIGEDPKCILNLFGIFPCESTALRDFSTFQRNQEAGLTLPFLSSPTLHSTPTRLLQLLVRRRSPMSIIRITGSY